MPSEIQSIYGYADEWDIRELLHQIMLMGYVPTKISKEGNQFRFRINSPKKYQHFNTHIAYYLDKKVYFVIGHYY